MTTVTSTQIWVKKDKIDSTQVVDKTLSTNDLAEDEVLLKTDSFGFSANNITYAALGFTKVTALYLYGDLPLWWRQTTLTLKQARKCLVTCLWQATG